MPLEISIYNKQQRTSASGKSYLARVCVFTPGQSGRLTEADQVAPFYTRDQKGDKQWIRLDARTITEAKAEATKAQDVRAAVAAGVPVLAQAGKDGDRLTVRIAAYLEEVESNKSRATYLAYNRSLELFKGSCHRQNLQDVRREDLLAFKTYLRKQDDLGDRAHYNHFLNVSVFFKWAKHPLICMGVRKNDWPVKNERAPEEYTSEEIEALLKAAAGTYRGRKKAKGEKKDDRLLLNSFRRSGLRDGEMSHLTYGDIDGKRSLWTIRPKEGHKLKTKGSQRSVPVGEWLTRKVLEQKKAEGKRDGDVIFPNTLGQPDEHLLRILKRISTKAGLTGRVDQHKFRSTAITTWLRNGSTVPEVMFYCGHVNPATILRYAANVNLQKPEIRNRVTLGAKRTVFAVYVGEPA
jgi:integrase